MNTSIKVLAKVGILIALYYLVYSFYMGIIHPIPAPGDSWDYHIPISKTILDGSFLHPPHWKMLTWYFPGSSEAINSVLLLLHIPLTLSNILPTIILFFACYKLARVFNLKHYFAILFGVTFITLNAVYRWQNAVSIDMWVAVWFTFAIILLEKPRKSIKYFAILGFVLGMLIGSKYTALYFLAIFFVLYIRNLYRFINPVRFIAFLVPFSVFGLFWYIRNYIFTGNPFYPLARLGFKGQLTYPDSVLNETLHHPLTMLNAVYGEYHLWLLSVIVAIAVLIHQFIIRRIIKHEGMTKIFLIGFINFVLYVVLFPTDYHPWIMVSSLRYSFPTFIPLLLGVFILAAKLKKEELLGYFAIANMLVVLTAIYYPKLILIYLPIGFLIFWFLDKKEKKFIKTYEK